MITAEKRTFIRDKLMNEEYRSVRLLLDELPLSAWQTIWKTTDQSCKTKIDNPRKLILRDYHRIARYFDVPLEALLRQFTAEIDPAKESRRITFNKIVGTLHPYLLLTNAEYRLKSEVDQRRAVLVAVDDMLAKFELEKH